jgi:hypothetical protein
MRMKCAITMAVYQQVFCLIQPTAIMLRFDLAMAVPGAMYLSLMAQGYDADIRGTYGCALAGSVPL